eukprot:scaffold9062_cov154-Amphora_coffeaeformis.AAC.3
MTPAQPDNWIISYLSPGGCLLPDWWFIVRCCWVDEEREIRDMMYCTMESLVAAEPSVAAGFRGVVCICVIF